MADPAGFLLDQIVDLQNASFREMQGHLFKSWLQMDEANPSYVVYVEGRKYEAVLDDGRETSTRARQCIEENVFDEDPTSGCGIQFDGEYLIEDNGGSVTVSLKLWNVLFK